MANVVLLYAESDAERARAISAAAAHLRPLLSPLSMGARPMAFGPQMVVMMAWSREAQAAGLGEVFSLIASNHVGALLVCACDGAEPPVALRQRHMLYDLESLRSLDGAAALRLGRLDEIRVAERPATQSLDVRRVSQAFAGGMFRGVAASVAFLGVGGAVALGAVDQLAADGTPAPAAAPDNMRVLEAVEAAPEFDWAQEETAAAVDDAELAAVQQRLAEAQTRLEAMREATEPFVSQLDSWSAQSWRTNPAETAAATSHDQLADFQSSAPIEALPLQPASAAADASGNLLAVDDGLWRPAADTPSAI
ncbi:MAG: hypothetical protein NW203_15730 [Hyphomonadaceae bacterium]|nr:hypothetical protein [Hyphomonadaceae bacterium]